MDAILPGNNALLFRVAAAKTRDADGTTVDARAELAVAGGL